MTYWWIILAVVIFWIIWAYNRLISFSFRAKEAISDIDVQLKRRANLIPNLVEAVKGYMAHEQGVLENVTKARTDVLSSAGSPLERDAKENFLSQTLKTLFAVAENYPDLKANVNFLELQRELSDTENKIQASRRFYNATVRDLNTYIDSFPSSVIAKIFSFSRENFFELENGSEKKTPEVKF